MTKRSTKKPAKAGPRKVSLAASPIEGTPASLTRAPVGYAEWLADVKARIHAAQQRAALAVNRELLTLYWQLGRDILDQQELGGWGAGIVDKVSADLRAAFPVMKGFSRANLMVHARVRGGLAGRRLCPTACWTIALGA
jgi:hypothetical protein